MDAAGEWRVARRIWIIAIIACTTAAIQKHARPVGAATPNMMVSRAVLQLLLLQLTHATELVDISTVVCDLSASRGAGGACLSAALFVLCPETFKIVPASRFAQQRPSPRRARTCSPTCGSAAVSLVGANN
jgi:hypothetical protein